MALGVHAHRFHPRPRPRAGADRLCRALPTRYPYTSGVAGRHRAGAAHRRLVALGGEVLRPLQLAMPRQDAEGVNAQLSDGRTLRARYLIGLRQLLQRSTQHRHRLPAAATASRSCWPTMRLSDGVPTDEVILYFSPRGMAVVAPLPDGVHRIVAPVDDARRSPTRFVQALLDERGPVRQLVRVLGEPVWGSRFRVHHRIAGRYPRRARGPGRRRRPRAQPGRRAGHEHGHLDAMRTADAGAGARR
ncbi:MAG: hypothetical protein U1F56_16085 [Rubrivivax sp.]